MHVVDTQFVPGIAHLVTHEPLMLVNDIGERVRGGQYCLGNCVAVYTVVCVCREVKCREVKCREIKCREVKKEEASCYASCLLTSSIGWFPTRCVR